MKHKYTKRSEDDKKFFKEFPDMDNHETELAEFHAKEEQKRKNKRILLKAKANMAKEDKKVKEQKREKRAKVASTLYKPLKSSYVKAKKEQPKNEAYVKDFEKRHGSTVYEQMFGD